MSSPSSTTVNASKVSMVSTVTAIVSLGSNLPFSGLSPQQVVLSAVERLKSISLETRVSSMYLTEPLGCPADTPDFVNAIMLMKLSAERSAADLLRSLQAIEMDFGRQRGAIQNQARSLDLDLISFGNQQLNDSSLTLPHPRALQRKFVLLPLSEISSDLVFPGQTKTVSQLLAQLSSQERVRRIAIPV